MKVSCIKLIIAILSILFNFKHLFFSTQFDFHSYIIYWKSSILLNKFIKNMRLTVKILRRVHVLRSLFNFLIKTNSRLIISFVKKIHVTFVGFDNLKIIFSLWLLLTPSIPSIFSVSAKIKSSKLVKGWLGFNDFLGSGRLFFEMSKVIYQFSIF